MLLVLQLRSLHLVSEIVLLVDHHLAVLTALVVGRVVLHQFVHAGLVLDEVSVVCRLLLVLLELIESVFSD